MAVYLWSLFIFSNVYYFSLLSYHFTICIFYCASIYKSFISLFILSYFLLPTHHISLLIFYYLYLVFYFLLSLQSDLISIDSLNKFLFFPYFHSVFSILNFSNFCLRFYNLSFTIFNNISLYNFGFTFFLNNIFFMLKHRSIITLLNLNRVFFFSEYNSIWIHYLVSLHHSHPTILLNY